MYNRDLFFEYLRVFKNLPPEYTEIEDIEMERPVRLPKECEQYRNCPVHIMPELIDQFEIFVPITHSPIMPNIIANRYYVSNYGRIFDAWKNKIVVSSDNGHGYRSVTLNFKVDSTTTKLKTVYVHRIVCFYFNYQYYAPGYIINHIDGIKHNNYDYNLEFVSNSENAKYRVYNDVPNCDVNRGENHYLNSIDEKTVRYICSLINSGITDTKVLSQTVGYSESIIRHIKAKDTWTWLTREYYIPDFYERCRKGLTEQQAEYICELIYENKKPAEICKLANVTDEQIECIKYNGAFPEIRAKYGI